VKKLLLPLLVACLSFSVPAWSQAYVGGSVGKSDHNQNRGDWSNGAGFTSSYDDSDTAYKVFGGYKFNPNFAVEGGYTDMGDYSARITGGGDVGNAKVKTNSLNVFAVGILPMDQFSLFAKAGVSRNKSKMDFNSTGVAFNATDSGSKNKTSFAWGIGASYAINKQLSVRVEYEDFGKAGETNSGFTVAGKTSNSKPRLLSAGLQYAF